MTDPTLPYILVVDDEPAICEMMADILRGAGHRVAQALSGPDAQEIVRAGGISVVMTDLRMSPMHGLELLEWLRVEYPDIVVIVMTAYGNMEVVVECLRLGAFDFLTKPVDNLDLIPLTVEKALDKHHLGRENQSLIERLQAHEKELTAAVRDASRKLTRDNMILQLGAEFTRRVVRSLEFDEIVQAAHECFSRFPMEWQYSLFLFDPQLKQFEMVANNHPDLDSDERIFVPVGQSPLMDEVMQTGETIILETFSGSRYDTGVRRHKYHAPPCMCIPLKMGDDFLGIMNINNFAPDRFYEVDYQMAIITSEYLTMALKNCRLYTQMKEMSERDGLTGLYNHAYFQNILEREVRRADRYGGGLSLIMMDLDGFKATNDRYGHLVGNAVLVELAALLKTNTRSQVDVMARYGGDEFAILLPETGLEGARLYAERLRQKIIGYTFESLKGTQTQNLTMSMGVAAYSRGKTRDRLIDEADRALYESKHAGRDRVSAFIDESVEAPPAVNE